MSLDRRTPLRRVTPLPPPSKLMSRGRGLQASVPLVRRAGQMAPRRTRGTASGQPLAPPEFTPAVRLLVRLRAGHGDVFAACCEGCWTFLGEKGGEYQHRVARGAGGCRDEIVNGPAGCLLLCRRCHSEAEERRRDLSQDGAGFWIEHGNGPDFDPRFTPVLLGALGDHGVMAYLAADGKGDDGTGYLLQPPQEVAA